MEEFSEENLKFLSNSEEINNKLIVPKRNEEKYPFKCILCPLKFSDMEGAKTHYFHDHEKQKVLSKKPVNIQTSELGNPCDEQVNEKQKYVKIEDFPVKIQENQKDVEIEELPQTSDWSKKPVKIRTLELVNPCSEQLNEDQEDVEIEELPQASDWSKKPVEIRTTELENTFSDQLNEKQKEELPRVVGQIVQVCFKYYRIFLLKPILC